MRKDIFIPEVKDVFIVAVKEWDESFLSQHWNVYLLNLSSNLLEAVLVVSSGHDEQRKTASLRHGFTQIEPQSFKKVEYITEEILGFTNHFMVTYFIGNTLYDKKYVFEPYSISEKNAQPLPLIDNPGVFAV
jgi:hypothetical protein